MARSPDALEDPTPIDADTPDVRRRVGWLLRTTRLHGAARTTAATFARELGVPPTAVSKWEKGTDDPGAEALEGYERALGRPPGVLRATVSGLRRDFDQPGRRTATPAPGELDNISDRVRAALTGPASGEDWLRFAATLSQGTALTLPDFLARPALDRLVSETVRAVDGAYLTRLEALALLRTGPYHGVVRSACLDFALDPRTQVSADVLGVLGTRPETSLLHTVCGLLSHPDDSVHTGACHALLTMRRSRPGLSAADLREVAPVVVEAYAASLDDPVRHRALSSVLQHLPQGFHKMVTARRLPDPAATGPGVAGTREMGWDLATEISVEVMHDLDARPEPLLARTVYEALCEDLSVRSAWARCLLMTLPYRDVVGRVVAARCAHATPAELEVLGPLVTHLGRPVVALAREWVRGRDPARQQHGLGALGHYAERVDPSRARALATSPSAAVARRAAYALGMSGSPALRQWLDDPDLPTPARVAARWWLSHGSRVDDADTTQPSAESRAS